METNHTRTSKGTVEFHDGAQTSWGRVSGLKIHSDRCHRHPSQASLARWHLVWFDSSSRKGRGKPPSKQCIQHTKGVNKPKGLQHMPGPGQDVKLPPGRFSSLKGETHTSKEKPKKHPEPTLPFWEKRRYPWDTRALLWHMMPHRWPQVWLESHTNHH